MNTFTPTLQQKAAINYDGSMVITACPGSGKTTIMKEKIRKIIPELPNHKGVIAITFTKKASQELEKKCKHHAHDTKHSFFGTIDSFCLKELILPFISRVWGSNPTKCKIVKRLQNPYKFFLKEEYTSLTIENILNDEGFKRLYNEGFFWMNSFAAIALHILNESAAAKRYIKAKYSHVFIDEYQDSSESQHQLFLKLFELGLTATAVGDAWQSIYEFRGGNPKLLNSLIEDNNNFKHFEIDINHRCHPTIVNYASRLLDPNFSLLPYDENDLRVFRCTLNGNLANVGQTISNWVLSWLKQGQVEKASDIAILAKKENSLKLLTSGVIINYRLYTDNPLDQIGSDCSELYSDLLAFRLGAISTIQDVINKQFDLISSEAASIAELRKMIRALRDNQSIDEFISKLHILASIINITETQESDLAIRTIMDDQVLIKQFMPLVDNEIQVMTLHKSKGLEFKFVLHIDLEEWSFPHRIRGLNWDDVHYPSLAQDTNLHYVGITRAENLCVLIRANLRQNKQCKFSPSIPSYFLRLPQLEGLYK
ncbi:UvrD/REP helicase [Xenorhabdus nematophila F1]|uniref:UvrD-helicase domain-containing protein n=1 Tax=Xenorhabdus nematophila TaxID=628 RepID=UPI00032755E4|nr:ATP-dependent helicase [Xenorhabdus nematophila]CCW31797.1 UvrD/REP helicase [Xenorhabdus nematophila F1]